MLWLWHFFLEKRQFSYVLIATLVLAGGYALLEIPKESAPDIEIPNGIVVTTLPGASAADMETLVTNKLEDQISGISHIDTMTSTSGEGVSTINVQFDTSADLNQSIQDLRDAVAKAVPDLPGDASAPSVLKINISDQPILVASIAGDLPSTEFSALGKSVSDDLKRITGVSKVDVAGVPDREVAVVVSKEKLQQYGLSLSSVVGAIASSNAALPAGSISMQGVNYSVNFKGGIDDPSDIETVAVGAQKGVPIYLRDIALISNGLASPTTYSRLSEHGEPSEQAITLTVYKQSGGSIQGVAKAVHEKLDELQETKLAHMNVYISPATDMGVQVGDQLGELTTTGLITVVLVTVTLLLTIGWRESLVAALSIPMSFLMAFIALYFTGNTLNFISLFALILAVGILVDSGIVVTEAIHARMRLHSDPLKAARAALADYAWPLIAGTMATVAVFAPLFFLSGIIGKYIAGIPYTLVFVLMASIFVALGLVPIVAIVLTRAHEKSRLELLQEHYTDKVTDWYRRTLRTLLERADLQKKFLWSIYGLFVLSLALPLMGLLSVAFLPQDDQDFVLINIEKPHGTTLAQTDLAVRGVEEILYQNPDIESFQTTVGQSSALQNGTGSSGSNYANITVNLPEERDKTSTDMVNELSKQLSVVTDAVVQVVQASNGPPSGAPIQVRFKGNDLDQLVVAADAGKQLLSTIPHVTNITASTKNNGTEFALSINRAKAAAYGVTTAQVAQTLRAAVNGVTATTVTQPDQDIDVVVKLNLNAGYTDPSNTTETTLDSIKNLTIPGTNGPVLLGSLLSDSLAPSNAVITHIDKLRVESVSAYTDGEITSADAVSTFQDRIGELALPENISVAYGGEQQDIDKSFQQMFIALIAGLVLMFMILIISFNSFRFTGHLLSIVPLSLIGVLGGLALTNQPISFTALLGVIALGGIIINHAIILMDSLLHHVAANSSKPLIDIVVDSAATRLRPIVLTTIATVIGMVPLAFSDPTWGPLAFSIMFGLSFALLLTLAFVPVLFYRAPHPELGLPRLSKRG